MGRGAVAGLALAALSTAGCQSSGGGGLGFVAQPVTVGVQGVAISRITIYQGVERELMIDGAPSTTEGVELVQGREAVVRLFYATDPSYDGKPLTGRVTVDDGAPIDVEATLGATSTQNSMGTTVNVHIPADRVGDTLKFSAALVRDTTVYPPPADNAAAHWPADGSKAPVAVTGERGTLRVVLVPFQYNYDRSGRLPDTSAAAIEKYRQRFYQLYPVSSVEVKVHDPVPWAGQLSRDGTGWNSVAQELFNVRLEDGDAETPETYYYGVFNPASSLSRYCGGGCLLGVTLLNAEPSDVGNPDLRQAIGVGYTESAMDTCAHEIGHAHGLLHANCGPGLDPNSIDVEYPFEKGSIGVWGFDLLTNKLIAPQTYTDIMSYCKTQWISDYHYTKLLNRGRNVNLPRWSIEGGGAGSEGAGSVPGWSDRVAQVNKALGPRVLHDVVMVDVDGTTHITRRPMNTVEQGGEAVAVQVRDEQGASHQVTGHYYRFDHMPGGWLLVPRHDSMNAAPVRADFRLDAQPRTALRLY